MRAITQMEWLALDGSLNEVSIVNADDKTHRYIETKSVSRFY